MRVTTAGVPHTAASVTVIPQPSRFDVLASTHARRYRSTSSGVDTWPGSLIQDSAAASWI